ncbi:MAG: Lrp/AsnC family transcriptional regulator [Deltaproteobacteria bacterium]|nr:Lrp/AsnC family transcriptional regulator [Deltaproteobacteria bacterium]
MDAEKVARDNAALAKAVQAAVPFENIPFATLGAGVGLSESQVLGTLRAWQEEGKLREISAVLEASAVGYETTLVASAVPDSDLERVARIACEHPTVTHCYRRDHRYNFWFTLGVPTDMGITATLKRLSRAAGGTHFVSLPRTHAFKIAVGFDLETRKNAAEAQGAPSEVAPIAVSTRSVRLFRALQAPLPLEPRPFYAQAAAMGLREDELVEFGRRHLGGAIRRYVATLRHRALGVRGNGLVAWQVPEDKIVEVGRTLALAPEVSHCYARESIPDFPYRLYTMVHGPDEESCLRTTARLAAGAGVPDYRVLFSTREYKKCRLRYFLPELDQWWNAQEELAS